MSTHTVRGYSRARPVHNGEEQAYFSLEIGSVVNGRRVGMVEWLEAMQEEGWTEYAQDGWACYPIVWRNVEEVLKETRAREYRQAPARIGTLRILPALQMRGWEQRMDPERVRQIAWDVWRVDMIHFIDCLANEMQRAALRLPSAYDAHGRFLGGEAVLNLADC